MLSLESKFIVQSFQEAVQAYLDYKRGDFASAQSRIFRAMEIDGTLICEYGYDILELHRIQLGHNMMRVMVRCGDYRQAAQLCADLLAYLEGEPDSWPFPSFGRGAHPLSLPEHLCAAMFTQISGELALMLAHLGTTEVADVFEPMENHAASKATEHCAHHPRVHHWLHAKRLWIRAEHRAYLEQIAGWLRDGPGEMPLLWRAAAADLYLLGQGFVTQGGPALVEQIATDARAWTQVPPQLRALFAQTPQAAPQ
jgi:hypothetical protein